MLVGVVEKGWGEKPRPAGGAGARRGQRRRAAIRRTEKKIMDAWFVGFYPAEEPRYTIAVLLDSGTHDSDDAAQVFAKSNGCPELFSCAGVSRPGDIARI